jgi:hypothetical protein
VAAQPIETRGSAARGFADKRRERPPSRDPEDDKGLQRVDDLPVMGPIRRERVVHLALQFTEDRPAMDHAGEVPLPRTDTCLIEVLPDAACQHVLEVRITVDCLLRSYRWRKARSGVAKDVRRFPADEIGDA